MKAGRKQFRRVILWCWILALALSAAVGRASGTPYPKGRDKSAKSKVTQPWRWELWPWEKDLAMSPDGKWLAAALNKPVGRFHTWSAIWLLNLEKGEAQLLGPGLDWEGLRGPLTFTPDSKALAVQTSAGGRCGSAKNAILALRLWDVSTGRELPDVCTPLPWIFGPNSIAFSPDGKFLSTAKSWSGSLAFPMLYDFHNLIRVWDRQTGARLKISTTYHGWLDGLAFSPDSSQLAVANNNHVSLLDIREKKEVYRYECGAMCSQPQFSPDGKLLAAVDGYRRIHAWDVNTGREHSLQQVRTARPYYLFDFCFVGQTQIAAGEDNAIRFWDVPSGREIRSLAFPQGAPRPFVFTPDGQAIVGGGLEANPVIHMWDATTGKELRHWDLTTVLNQGAPR